MSAPRAAIFGCRGPRLLAEERAFFREAEPWGFIVFARNVEDGAQLRALTSELRESVGREAPILVDQEGGRVARLRGPVWRDWDGAGELCARLRRDPDAAVAAEEALNLRYRLIAEELRASGIDVCCAPLLDVLGQATHAFLRDRALGDDPEAVARLGRAVRRGLETGGVSAVVKHMPGHGRGAVDSHLGLPVAEASLEELRRVDFAPFVAHADAAMGMTAHVVYPAIDPEAPGTLSPGVIGAIREEIGFDGLLMTDDISMGALSGSIGGRAERALAAGCDVVLHCDGDRAAMAAVAAAAPRLEGRAQERAEAAERRPAVEPLDVAAAEARLAALGAGPVRRAEPRLG